jgi:hypothetical protein
MSNPITQSFIDGFLSFFCLGENPIEKHYQDLVSKRKERNEGLSGWEIDARNLYGDWKRVGMDIQKAYEQETSTANK